MGWGGMFELWGSGREGLGGAMVAMVGMVGIWKDALGVGLVMWRACVAYLALVGRG